MTQAAAAAPPNTPKLLRVRSAPLTPGILGGAPGPDDDDTGAEVVADIEADADTPPLAALVADVVDTSTGLDTGGGAYDTPAAAWLDTLDVIVTTTDSVSVAYSVAVRVSVSVVYEYSSSSTTISALPNNNTHCSSPR